MCDQCVKIDVTIARFKRLRDQINNTQAQEAATHLLVQLEAKKAALHPE